MNIIIFIIILFVLILVHELGHFIVAKRAGIRVDEFGIGFPPRAKKLFHKNGTDYTLNWIPFGGFVKIHGENYEDQLEGKTETKPDSFVSKPKYIQALVLVAGVAMNFLLAWFLISIGFMVGLPTSAGEGIDKGKFIQEPTLTVLGVTADSPAALAGLVAGDTVLKIEDKNQTVIDAPTPELLQGFIKSHSNEEIVFTVNGEGGNREVVVTPKDNIVDGHAGIGISMDMVGVLRLPFFASIGTGFSATVNMTKAVAQGLGGIFTGSTDLGSVTGPVGIVSIVGDAASFGFTHLLSLTAIISLNLAVINLVPFPALDGGRLLFVGIEAITKKQIPPRIFSLTNAIGFYVLIALMLLVTVRDIVHLF